MFSILASDRQTSHKISELRRAHDDCHDARGND
jgi:hypothetical protein